MKHSIGCSISLHFRWPQYTRGQPFRLWLLSAQANVHRDLGWSDLARPGAHAERVAWVRVTIVGVSLQINLEHAISNWPKPKP